MSKWSPFENGLARRYVGHLVLLVRTTGGSAWFTWSMRPSLNASNQEPFAHDVSPTLELAQECAGNAAKQLVLAMVGDL